MDANAGSHGDDLQKPVPATHSQRKTETGGNSGVIATDSKRYFPPRKAAAPAKKKPAPWRILRWWPALAAVLAVAAAVVLGFYLWQASRGQEMNGLSTQVKVSGQLGEQPVVQFQGRMPLRW